MLKYIFKNYEDLSKDELYDILKLRQEVFVVEQNCPYLDIDEKDQKAFHIMGRDAQGFLHTYSRLLKKGVSYEHYFSIGRVLTSKSYRGKGEGRQVMDETIQLAEQKKWMPLKLSAQVYAIPFYEQLGFKISGETYLEDDIPHVGMVRETVSDSKAVMPI